LAGLSAVRAEPVCDAPTEEGYRVVLSMEITGVTDGEPYQSGPDWIVERTTTLLPLCSYFTPVGSYSCAPIRSTRKEDRARDAVSWCPAGRELHRPVPAKLTKNIVVVGRAQRAVAALAAAEAARAKSIAVAITLVDKAPEQEAGGNTAGRRPICGWRRSIASSRRSSTTCWRQRGFRAMRGISPRWRSTRGHGEMDRRPRRAVPSAGLLSGEGAATHPAGWRWEIIHRELTRAAREVGVIFRFDCAADALITENDTIKGVHIARRRRCPPMPWCSPAAASRPMLR